MTANIELESESECLLCTRSVFTNLMTSLEFNPIRCATKLCHFGQTWNGSVAINSFFAAALQRVVLQAAT